MACCHQATSHYLSQCWPRSMSRDGVTRPQWVNPSGAEFWNIPELGHYHGCCCPGSLCHQDIRPNRNGKQSLSPCSLLNGQHFDKYLSFVRFTGWILFMFKAILCIFDEGGSEGCCCCWWWWCCCWWCCCCWCCWCWCWRRWWWWWWNEMKQHGITEKQALLWCQLCCHWQHGRLSLWQPAQLPGKIKFASGRFCFQWYTLTGVYFKWKPQQF